MLRLILKRRKTLPMHAENDVEKEEDITNALLRMLLLRMILRRRKGCQKDFSCILLILILILSRIWSDSCLAWRRWFTRILSNSTLQSRGVHVQDFFLGATSIFQI